MPESAWLWFYVACMAAGALLFFCWSRSPRGVPHHEYAIAMLIPIWSGLAYTAMALGQGAVEVGGDRVHVARYLDWLVTTPLLLIALASTAMFRRKLDKSLIAVLVAADVIMILSGLIADLTEREAVKWFWYTVGCVALLMIFWLVWGRLRAIAFEQGGDLGRLYTRVAAFLSVLWVGYPIIWALGPSGAGLFGRSTDTALFVLLPILSKVGFSIYDLSELRKLDRGHARHELGAGRGAPA